MAFYMLAMFFVSLMLGWLAHPIFLWISALCIVGLLVGSAIWAWGVATGRWGFFGERGGL